MQEVQEPFYFSESPEVLLFSKADSQKISSYSLKAYVKNLTILDTWESVVACDRAVPGHDVVPDDEVDDVLDGSVHVLTPCHHWSLGGGAGHL